MSDAKGRRDRAEAVRAARTFFNWAIERSLYGLETSPCDKAKSRDRVLDDDGIRLVWRAGSKAGRAENKGKARRRKKPAPDPLKAGYPFGTPAQRCGSWWRMPWQPPVIGR
jgi:hypothetical protein